MLLCAVYEEKSSNIFITLEMINLAIILRLHVREYI